jgi:hypothetical protein
MVFYHQTLSIFPSFQHQIEHFLCHWKHKLKSYKFSLNLKDKGTKQRMQEEKKWYFVSNCVSRPPLLPTTISWSFLIHFERFHRLQMCSLKIYKTCLKWKIKKTIVEKRKLQNHIEHLWKNPKHNPVHFERAYLVHFPLDCNMFLQIWICQVEDYKIVLSFKRNKPWTRKL